VSERKVVKREVKGEEGMTKAIKTKFHHS
jgi:hypothetical protein